MTLAISKLKMVYIFIIIDVIFYQVKMLLFYDIQTTNLTFVGKNMRYRIHSYFIV